MLFSSLWRPCLWRLTRWGPTDENSVALATKHILCLVASTAEAATRGRSLAFALGVHHEAVTSMPSSQCQTRRWSPPCSRQQGQCETTFVLLLSPESPQPSELSVRVQDCGGAEHRVISCRVQPLRWCSPGFAIAPVHRGVGATARLKSWSSQWHS